ncbi:MAG: MBL fold metallo-hydrolase [Desulfomonilaceae bacterium]
MITRNDKTLLQRYWDAVKQSRPRSWGSEFLPLGEQRQLTLTFLWKMCYLCIYFHKVVPYANGKRDWSLRLMNLSRSRMMVIKFWGVHGSLPRPGSSTLKFGGNTPCVEIRSGQTLVILDAGSGIRELGEDILRRQKSGLLPEKNLKGHILISHLHWDHVQGFPFFGPAYQRGNEFHLYCGKGLIYTIDSLMRRQMSEPNFPVRFGDMAASIVCHDVEDGQTIAVDDVRILVRELSHPGGCYGYRIEAEGKIISYASDTEVSIDVDQKMLELAQNADILIHDCMFTPEQYHGLDGHCSRESWGHSTWEGAVRTAKSCSIKHLILFHHGNDDATVEAIEKKAREAFPNTTAAYEGLEIDL